MKRKPILCKPVKGGMTEQEKCEAGYLYNPNRTTEMAAWRFKVQDAMCEYNKLKVSAVKKRRDFLAKWFGKIITAIGEHNGFEKPVFAIAS